MAAPKNGRIFTLREMHFGRANAVSHYEELCFGMVNTISHYAKLYFGAGAQTHVHLSRNAFRGEMQFRYAKVYSRPIRTMSHFFNPAQ